MLFLGNFYTIHTSFSSDAKMANCSTGGGDGLAEDGTIVGRALPGGAPGGGRRPSGEAFGLASVVERDPGGVA